MKNDVTSFFYYMWNTWCEEECKIVYGAEYMHFWNKWVYFCKEYGVRSAVDRLYAEEVYETIMNDCYSSEEYAMEAVQKYRKIAFLRGDKKTMYSYTKATLIK